MQQGLAQSAFPPAASGRAGALPPASLRFRAATCTVGFRSDVRLVISCLSSATIHLCLASLTIPRNSTPYSIALPDARSETWTGDSTRDFRENSPVTNQSLTLALSRAVRIVKAEQNRWDRRNDGTRRRAGSKVCHCRIAPVGVQMQWRQAQESFKGTPEPKVGLRIGAPQSQTYPSGPFVGEQCRGHLVV
jgi:hypothetical protein